MVACGERGAENLIPRCRRKLRRLPFLLQDEPGRVSHGPRPRPEEAVLCMFASKVRRSVRHSLVYVRTYMDYVQSTLTYAPWHGERTWCCHIGHGVFGLLLDNNEASFLTCLVSSCLHSSHTILRLERLDVKKGAQPTTSGTNQWLSPLSSLSLGPWGYIYPSIEPRTESLEASYYSCLVTPNAFFFSPDSKHPPSFNPKQPWFVSIALALLLYMHVSSRQ